jgi:hypothetical protein
MEALKIAASCVVAAILYGIVHDQFTARICIEYFTIFHPPIFHTQSPTLLGIGWGIVATWWVGVFFGVPMILAARAGSRRAFRASELLPSIASFACPYGCNRGALRYHRICTCSKGSAGYGLANVLLLTSLALPFHGGLVGTHSFLRGCFRGGVVLCVMTYRRRLRQEPTDRRGQ